MRKVILLLLAVMGAFFTMELSAQKIFLNVDGIEGESTIRGFEKQVEVQSYAHSAAGCQDVSGGGSRATGCKITSSGFQFSMNLSSATNGFRERLYTGKVIPKVKVSFVKSGQTPLVFYTIELTNVRVTALSESGSDGGDIPNVFIELSPATALWSYYMQNAAGVPTLTNQFGWDFQKAGSL